MATDQLARVLCEIFRDWDPHGLIAHMGAPTNEYDFEANRVAAHLADHPDAEVASTIRDVMERAFGPTVPPPTDESIRNVLTPECLARIAAARKSTE